MVRRGRRQYRAGSPDFLRFHHFQPLPVSRFRPICGTEDRVKRFVPAAMGGTALSTGKEKQADDKNRVTEAEKESFPSSDPPSWTSGEASPEADAKARRTQGGRSRKGARRQRGRCRRNARRELSRLRPALMDRLACSTTATIRAARKNSVRATASKKARKVSSGPFAVRRRASVRCAASVASRRRSRPSAPYAAAGCRARGPHPSAGFPSRGP